MSAKSKQMKLKVEKTPEEKEAAKQKAAELKAKRTERELVRTDSEAPFKASGLGRTAITTMKIGMRPDDEVTAAIGQLLLLALDGIAKKMVYNPDITAEEVARAFKALPWNLRQGDRNLEVSRTHMADAFDLQIELKLYASLLKRKQTLNDSYEMQQYLREIFWVLYGPFIEVTEDKDGATKFRDEVAAYLGLTISEAARTDPDVRANNFRERVLERQTDPSGLDLFHFPHDVRYNGQFVVAFYVNPATDHYEEEIVPVGELLKQKGIETRFAFVDADGKLQGVPDDWSPCDPDVFTKLIELVKSLDTPFTVAVDKLDNVTKKEQLKKLDEEWFDPDTLVFLFQEMMHQAEKEVLLTIVPEQEEEKKKLFKERTVHADAMSALLRVALMTVFNLHKLGKHMANHVKRKVKMTQEDFRAVRAITVKQDMESGAVGVEKPLRNDCYPYQPVAEAGVFRHDLPDVMAQYKDDIVKVLQDYQEFLIAAGAREEGGLHYA